MRLLLSSVVIIAGLLANYLTETGVAAEAKESSSLLLTNADQIRNLTAAEAARSLPVRLQGVVVDDSQPREHAVILADQSAEIYITAVTNLFAPWHQNDFLEIFGVTAPGEFAPIVLANEVRWIRKAPLPTAHPTTYQDLITGAMDAQLVEISGVVRQCWPPETNSDIWRIVLSASGGTFPVRIALPQNQEVQVDAEVTLHALCFYQFNEKRQALSPILQVPHGFPVQVNKLSPADPFAADLRAAASLLQFDSKVSYGHRVHVRGTVIGFEPGSFVWIRDASSGLRIQTQEQNQLELGDEIDVLGFPSYGATTPRLKDAIYRKIGMEAMPVPVNLNFISLTNVGNYQDDLVSIEAKLTDIHPILNGEVLTLEKAGTVFKAVWKESINTPDHLDLQPGSLVRVTGICSGSFDDAQPAMGIWQPQSFQILLRSAADISVIKPPSWWTARHIILTLALMVITSLVIIGLVVWIARRRLHEQSRRRIMAETEFAAILNERNRLAREIHDTLAQGLTATSLQLQLVQKNSQGASPKMIEHLKLSQQLVRSSLDEARSSIWNMRSQVLESGNLAEAFKMILKQLTDDTAIKTSFDMTGRERRLSPMIENNLLRFGQEAITNAVKHARAKHISVAFDFDRNQINLKVTDDGCGFNSANPRASTSSFGLVGIKERAKELNAELKIRSTPGQGTEIQLLTPLTEE